MKYSEAAEAKLSLSLVLFELKLEFLASTSNCNQTTLFIRVKLNKVDLTGLQLGVFHSLSQVVHGNKLVKEAKKKRSAQAMITL